MNLENQKSPLPKALLWSELAEKRKQGDELLFLDMRSEKEFEKSHVTGASNLPLLNNEERHEVGTLYKKEGKNKAIVLGFSFFQRKSEKFLKEVEKKVASLGKNGKLVIYCARGGMRSRLTAGFLASLGHPVLLAEGGYKAYRKQVLETLEEKLVHHPLLVLHGHTGSGKTELIKELEKPCYEIGTLDFEGLAHHSGSTFGNLNHKEKPSTQGQFENDLYEAYKKVEHLGRIVVEIESTLGQVKLFPKLRQALVSSPMIQISRARAHRVNALTKEYTRDWNEEKKTTFLERLEPLQAKFSKDCYQKLVTLLEEENFQELADILLKDHYDPRYEKSLKRYEEQIIAHFSFSSAKKELLNFIKSYVSRKNSGNLLRA